MKTTTVTISRAAYVAAITETVAEDDIRWYLNGFLIEEHPAGGILLVSTNGHQLSAIHDERGTIERGDSFPGDTQIIVDLPKANRAPFRKVSNLDQLVTIELTEEQPVLLSVSGTTVQGAKLEGTFPDWRRVVPTVSDSGLVGHMDVSFFAKINKQASLLKRGPKNPVQLRQPDKNSSALVFLGNSPEFLGIVMPMRNDTDISQGLIEEITCTKAKLKKAS